MELNSNISLTHNKVGVINMSLFQYEFHTSYISCIIYFNATVQSWSVELLMEETVFFTVDRMLICSSNLKFFT